MHSRSIVQQAQLPYSWPDVALGPRFTPSEFDSLFCTTTLAEDAASMAADSRWPAFFPSPICLLTAGSGERAVLERVVGPMIVNRFPLIMAVSLCRETLSDRHYARRETMAEIERSGAASVQFLAPGPSLSSALAAVAAEPDAHTMDRLGRSTLRTSPAALTRTQVIDESYLIYEGRLAEPGVSLEGHRIYDRPWLDVGSHRVYFLEVVAIHLKTPIARGERQIAWHSLPVWEPRITVSSPEYDGSLLASQRYVKSYTPDYRFPSPGTVAFEADEVAGEMSIRHLPPLAADQVSVDNDRARWPCFFPSSAGIVTAWQDNGSASAMPCGSTAIVARFPLTFATCISNSAINERYAPRATLNVVRARQRLGIGVPFADPHVVRAISYMGNVSSRVDPDKVRHAGLTGLRGGGAPVIAELPIHFDCRVAAEVNLGTHVMVLAEVERVHVRRDVTPEQPIGWLPWATVV
jgi:flavin reductase (DIM6/NTAB) family NADH-FMN oxidoreductase RutF